MPGSDQLFDFHAVGMMFLYLALALSVSSAVTYTFGFRDGLRAQAR